MNKKTVLILVAVSVGGCCLFGTAAIALAALASDDSSAEVASTDSPPGPVATTGGSAKLGGYVIWGVSTPVAEGFAESLVGNWMLMDGASVESIEAIHSDSVVVKTSRTGELWHFTFDADGSYVFRYLITAHYNKVLWVEKGEWSSDGAQLTLSPQSCTSKAPSETTDCLDSAVRTYALTTVRLEELTPNDRKGVTFNGVRFTGPFPAYSVGPSPYAYRELQRVQ